MAFNANSSDNEWKKERKPDLIQFSAPRHSLMQHFQPQSGRPIWLKFVGNKREWGDRGTQQIQTHEDKALIEAMREFADRVQESFYSLRFYFDGKRLDGSMCARFYELDDGDQIDVFQQQYGGHD